MKRNINPLDPAAWKKVFLDTWKGEEIELDPYKLQVSNQQHNLTYGLGPFKPTSTMSQLKIWFLPFFKFTQAAPTDYVIVSKDGIVTKEGLGLTTWYGPSTIISIIPQNEQKQSFQYALVSKDGIEYQVAGEIKYTINHKTARSKFNWVVEPLNGGHADAPTRDTGEAAANACRQAFLTFAASRDIKDLVAARSELEVEVQKQVAAMVELSNGIKIQLISITSAAPDGKIATALRAHVTETLLGAAETALAARQQAAEESRRTLLLKQAETNLQVEAQKSALIDTQIANNKKAAAAEKENVEEQLAPWRNLSPAWISAFGFMKAGKMPEKLSLKGMSFDNTPGTK